MKSRQLELKLKKELKDLIKSFNKNQKELIKKAYDFSKKKHKGQKFSTTHYDYFLHPLYSAVLLARWQRNYEEIIAGLLHDVIEDCEVSIWEIHRLFGFRIAYIVNSVSYNRKWNYEKKNCPPDREGHYKKIMQNSIKDVGVLYVHLADTFGKVNNLINIKIKPKSFEKKKKRLRYKLEYIYPLLKEINLDLISNKMWQEYKEYFKSKPKTKLKTILSKKDINKIKEELSKQKILPFIEK